MQSRPTETSHNNSNLSISKKLVNSNHGSYHYPLRSNEPLNTFEEESCRFKYSEVVYDDVESYSKKTILQTHPYEMPQDPEMISESSSIRTKQEAENIILKIEPKNKARHDGVAQLTEIPIEILTQILSYLPISSITTSSLVSKRFHKLVNTSHVWRTAFLRTFKRESSYFKDEKNLPSISENREKLDLETLLFNRLSRSGTWRSEYIIRTRLLNSLERGKPAQNVPKFRDPSQLKNIDKNSTPVITYSSHLFATVNHIHSTFDFGAKNTRFIHGSDEISSATISDPTIGKIGKWGVSEPRSIFQFGDVWTGRLPYGMDNGPALVPNSMDVSSLHGVIIGEGIPGGKIYYQSLNETRGRYLSQASNFSDYENGIPKIPEMIDGVSAVWISKSHSVPNMTDGLIGMLCGSTMGVVSAYASGIETTHVKLNPKGLITAKWVLSPGVPIIAFDVDESYNPKRKACGRVWAVALNALGEVFYLSRTPFQVLSKRKKEEKEFERLAWSVGRTVYWEMINESRRAARNIPFHNLEKKLSCSPRSSSIDFNLSQTQIRAESIEIEKYFEYTPAFFRNTYKDWDMRRTLHVDFAGEDGNGAGEAIIVIKCGGTPGQHAEVRRMTRIRRKRNLFGQEDIVQISRPQSLKASYSNEVVQTQQDKLLRYSNFSALNDTKITRNENNSTNSEFSSLPPSWIRSSNNSSDFDEWQTTFFSLKDQPKVQITCSAIDMSTFALLKTDEDPMNNEEFTHFDVDRKIVLGTSSSVPGHRARFLVAGTKNGSLIIWNMRGPRSIDISVINELHPLRKIHTDSPEISCIAVSALYVVHGGNDGLVQAWNPLGSDNLPIRTFHSRSSSKARHRTPSTEVSSSRGRININSAGAILLDPDPTKLRGIVSIGSQLRFWAYSSSVTNELSKKRFRRRHFERSVSAVPDRFSNSGRGAIRDYIISEQEDMKKEKIQKNLETTHLSNRFGVGIFGLTEEEAILYAESISAQDYEEKRHLPELISSQPAGSKDLPKILSSRNNHFNPDFHSRDITVDDFERDISEAIRLSLLENSNPVGQF